MLTILLSVTRSPEKCKHLISPETKRCFDCWELWGRDSRGRDWLWRGKYVTDCETGDERPGWGNYDNCPGDFLCSLSTGWEQVLPRRLIEMYQGINYIENLSSHQHRDKWRDKPKWFLWELRLTNSFFYYHWCTMWMMFSNLWQSETYTSWKSFVFIRITLLLEIFLLIIKKQISSKELVPSWRWMVHTDKNCYSVKNTFIIKRYWYHVHVLYIVE